MEYSMSLTKAQLIIIRKALEEYFRLRMGQDRLSEDMAALTLDPHSKDDMADYDRLKKRLEGAMREYFLIAFGPEGTAEKTEEMLVAEDIWDSIRVSLGTSKWSDALHVGKEPLPVIEALEDEDSVLYEGCCRMEGRDLVLLWKRSDYEALREYMEEGWPDGDACNDFDLLIPVPEGGCRPWLYFHLEGHGPGACFRCEFYPDWNDADYDSVSSQGGPSAILNWKIGLPDGYPFDSIRFELCDQGLVIFGGIGPSDEG